MQLLDLGAHGDAELGVEVRQRLVEQEHLRVAHDGAPHGDALALAARELARIASEELGQTQDLGGLVHPLLDQFLLDPPELQREAHVVGDGHVRIERVILENHRDVPLFRRNVVDDALADQDVALRNLLEPRDHAEQRRFPTARRADEDDELAVADVDVHPVYDFHRAKGFADLA